MFGFKRKDKKVYTPDGNEGCFVSDHITHRGKKVGYMDREEPDAESELPDSGWRFFSGEESDEYVNDPQHIQIVALTTVCTLDGDIVSCLAAPYGSAFYREGDIFLPDV